MSISFRDSCNVWSGHQIVMELLSFSPSSAWGERCPGYSGTVSTVYPVCEWSRTRMKLWREAWLAQPRKPLKRFQKTRHYCNPKLKLGENETFARDSLTCRDFELEPPLEHREAHILNPIDKLKRFLQKSHKRQFVDCSRTAYKPGTLNCSNATNGSLWILQVRPIRSKQPLIKNVPSTQSCWRLDFNNHKLPFVGFKFFFLSDCPM